MHMWTLARCLGSADSYSVLERAVHVRVSFVHECVRVCTSPYRSECVTVCEHCGCVCVDLQLLCERVSESPGQCIQNYCKRTTGPRHLGKREEMTRDEARKTDEGQTAKSGGCLTIAFGLYSAGDSNHQMCLTPSGITHHSVAVAKPARSPPSR